MSENVVLFTTRVRKATRKIHSMSDALVHAKFAISLRDKAVWGGGLFVFYHIFAFLEDAKERLNMPDYNKLFVHKSLYRKKAFQTDLTYYLGDEWKSMPRTTALEKYLDHLQELEKENPHLLLAYVYHLYLSLLSAAQILTLAYMKKMFGDKTKDSYTDQVTDFTDIDIPQLKNDFRTAMNEIAATMSPEEQQAFLDESNQVFLMNNLIVNSVAGQNQVLHTMLYKASAIFLVILGAVLAYKMHTCELRNRIYGHYFLD